MYLVYTLAGSRFEKMREEKQVHNEGLNMKETLDTINL